MGSVVLRELSYFLTYTEIDCPTYVNPGANYWVFPSNENFIRIREMSARCTQPTALAGSSGLGKNKKNKGILGKIVMQEKMGYFY